MSIDPDRVRHHLKEDAVLAKQSLVLMGQSLVLLGRVFIQSITLLGRALSGTPQRRDDPSPPPTEREDEAHSKEERETSL